MDYYIQGLKPQQIAERLDLTHSYISTIIRSPNFQHTLAIRRKQISDQLDDKVVNAEIDAARVLKEHAKEAAEKMAALLDSDNDLMIFKSSSDILDRVGPQKQSKGAEAAATVVIIDENSAKLIKDTFLMSGSKE